MMWETSDGDQGGRASPSTIWQHSHNTYSFCIDGSSEIVETTKVGSSDPVSTTFHFQRSHDIHSFCIDGSSEIVETERLDSSDFLSVPITFRHSRDVRLSSGIRASRSFDFVQPDGPAQTWPDQFDSSVDQAQGSAVVWISTAGFLGAILLSISAAIFLIGCRRSLVLQTNVTESEFEVCDDSQFSSTAIDPFVSEQNALSHGSWTE
jgi:hypothetical protein